MTLGEKSFGMLIRKSTIIAIVVSLCLFSAFVHGADVALSKQEAIAAAEKFIRENGYTDSAGSAIKAELDHEGRTLTRRDTLLIIRFNSLVATAIGAYGDTVSWFVFFDYVGEQRDWCRVVAMMRDGSKFRWLIRT